MILLRHKSKSCSTRALSFVFCSQRLQIFFVLLCFAIIACEREVAKEDIPLPSQAIVADFAYDLLVEKSKAKADFYQGVRLLNLGNVAEAIVALQRALSLEPTNTLVRYWLARAHAAYGQRKFANLIYKELVDANFYPTYLSAQLELSQHMALANSKLFLERGIHNAVRAVSLDLAQRNYHMPMSVRSLSSGSLLISALGSNVLGLFNPISMSDRQFVKKTALLNRPMDAIILKNTNVIVTEFASNKVSAFSYEGAFLGSFIQNPVPVTFEGPQFLATDTRGNIYVSIAGTARIIKFDSDGAFLLEFGNNTNDDGQLLEPTGIAVVEDVVWVLDHADQVLSLVQYDENGNFIGRHFVAETRGESLRAYGHFLLMATETSIMLFDTKNSKIVDELTSADFVKITSATFDSNEMLWVIDQSRERLEAFSEATSQYSGFHTKVLSLRTKNFPNVTARVLVTSASQKPVVGLERNNFVLFEDDTSVATMRVRSDDETIQNTNIVVVPLVRDDSVHKAHITESIEQLVNGGLLVQSAEDVHNEPVNFWVMNASSILGYQLKKGNVAVEVIDAVKKAMIDSVSSQEKRTQLHAQSFRMAINTLLPLAGKKVVLFIGDSPESDALRSQTWKQMMGIARSNAISIVWVYVKPTAKAHADVQNSVVFQNMVQSDDRVLSNVSNVFYYPYLMQNVQVTLAARLLQSSPGVYTIAFQSRYSVESGKYVVLSLESYYFTRSGKDISGYVIPAQ